jgi:hypothetical protein
MSDVAEVKMKLEEHKMILEEHAAAHAAALEKHAAVLAASAAGKLSVASKPPAIALEALKTLANNRGLQLRCEDERVSEQEWRARYALTTSEGHEKELPWSSVCLGLKRAKQAAAEVAMDFMTDQACTAPWKQALDALYAAGDNYAAGDKAPEAAWEELEPGEKLARCMQAEVTAQAAEVRAVAVVAADAEFLACSADLQLVTARRDMQYGKSVSSSELSVLEERVRRARADAAVAKAVEAQARASLQALQARRA